MALVGREAEIATIAAHLDAMPDSPRALLLTGEPGIGKSTLLGEAIERASTQGRATLVLRPGPAEIALAYSGLTDLVEAIGWDVTAGLPTPQRDALAVATARLIGIGPLDQRTVATATLGTSGNCHGSARCSWSSTTSSGSTGPPPGAWTTHCGASRMSVSRSSPPIEPARRCRSGFDLHAALGGRLHRLRVGPLPPRELERLLRSRMGHEFARYEMLEVGRRAGGNPFLALEMGRALTVGDGTDRPPEALIADDLVTLLGRRVERLPRPTQTALGAVAILSEPTPDLVDLIVGAGASRALDPAFEADVIERIGDRLSFTHPLFATAVVRGVSRTTQQDLHHRAAEVTGPEERAITWPSPRPFPTRPSPRPSRPAPGRHPSEGHPTFRLACTSAPRSSPPTPTRTGGRAGSWAQPRHMRRSATGPCRCRPRRSAHDHRAGTDTLGRAPPARSSRIPRHRSRGDRAAP